MATNLEVEVIEPAEEGRLTVNAVLHAWATTPTARRRGADRRHRRRQRTVDAAAPRGDRRLGQLRPGLDPPSGNLGHRPGVGRTGRRPVAAPDRQHGGGDSRPRCRSTRWSQFIAVGGDARFAAARIGQQLPTADLSTMESRSSTTSWRNASCTPPADWPGSTPSPLPTRKRWSRPVGLPGPAAATKVEQMLVSDVSMRDGLLLDLTQTIQAEEAHDHNSIIQSAKGIGEKYHYDARTPSTWPIWRCSSSTCAHEHRLSDHERLLLYVAGLCTKWACMWPAARTTSTVTT